MNVDGFLYQIKQNLPEHEGVTVWIDRELSKKEYKRLLYAAKQMKKEKLYLQCKQSVGQGLECQNLGVLQ